MLKNPSFTFKLTSLVLATSLLGLAGCNFASNDANLGLEDSSASGAVAAIIGGAILAGNPTTAMSSNTCPTVASASGCSNLSGSAGVALTFSNCTYGGTSGSRTGVLNIIAGGLNCGTGMPASVTQQYSTGQQTSANNVVTGFDDQSSNIRNFDGDTVNPLSGSGYGISVSYTSGSPTSMTIARYVSTPFTMYSVVGVLTAGAPAAITLSGTFPNLTATGHVTVYDNRLQVVGTSTLNALTFQGGCCFPVGGSISTIFQQGANATTNPAVQPTATGSLYVSKTETLTFTGCGTATFADAISGQPTNLAFSHCY